MTTASLRSIFNRSSALHGESVERYLSQTKHSCKTLHIDEASMLDPSILYCIAKN